MSNYLHTFFAPFYIFIKDDGKATFEEILNLIGLNDYHSIPFEENTDIQFSVYLTRLDGWIHVMDNTYYQLWHILNYDQYKLNINRLENIGKKYDLFSFFLGDTTECLEYYYYKNGRLVRRYVYNEELNDTVSKLEEYGSELEGENQAKMENREYALNVAQHLGINTSHKSADIRLFANPKREIEQW